MSDPIAELLLGLAVRGSLLVLGGAAIVTLLHRASAAARHLVWSAAALALVALVPLGLLGVSVDLPVLSEPATVALPTTRPPAVAAPGPMPVTVSGSATAPAARVRAPDPRPAVIRLLTAIYLGGAMLVLARFLTGVGRARRIAHRATGWRRQGRARILLSDEVRAPVTWGLRRPVIVLPRTARDWPRDERRRALLHELAHVDRRDWQTRVLARLACVLYWFNPLVWWMERRLLLEAERAADDRVVLATGDSPSYAAQLLRLAAGLRRPDLALGIHLARRRHLACRIQAILDPELRRTNMTRSTRIWLTAALCLVLASVSTIRLTAAAHRGAGTVSAELTDEIGELARAALAGDLASVRKLVAAGADPSGAPLVLASSRGHVEVVDALLAAGADPDAAWRPRGRDHDFGRTPLVAASKSGHALIVERLLDAGATVDRVIAGDPSALIAASGNGHSEVVDRLLAAGADPELEVRGDGSPLIAAAASGDLALVRRLLDAGADPDAWVTGDENPLYHAIHNGDADLVRELLARGADFDATWPGDGNPVIVAARAGDGETLDVLLAAGADIDRGVPGDGNALIETARQGDLDLTLRLIAAGADVNAAVPGDGNPLIAAAGMGDLEIVRVLVESGARVNQVVPGDENALIQAAGAGHLEVVRYLVGQGADVHARVPTPYRKEIRTALGQAARGGHPEVADYLRSVGARE